jgi:hypothetical protein
MRPDTAPAKSFELTFNGLCKILFLHTLSRLFRDSPGPLLALTKRVIYSSPDAAPCHSTSRQAMRANGTVASDDSVQSFQERQRDVPGDPVGSA